MRHDFLSSLQSCFLISIDKQTRVRSYSATLIDNIFVNTPDNITECGKIISDISDHFSQFCILKSARDKTKTRNLKMRDFSNFSRDGFNDDLVNDSRDVNSVFSTFYNKFIKLINKHAPMKTISKRKAKLLSKPWITKGLRISVEIKNKLYASGDMIQYKVYRNKLCSLIRLSKQKYYTKFFDDSLNNMKKTWQGINDIPSPN